MKLIHALAATAFACMLPGCTTNLTGARLRAQPSGELKGIPVNMTKPQFAVSHQAAATADGEATTSLTLSYVADPDRRYVMNMDPNWLTSTGFTVNLGTQGQLMSINATGTSTAVDTIQTIGKVVKAAVATGAFNTGSAYRNLAGKVSEEELIADTDLPPHSCLDDKNMLDKTLMPRTAMGAPARATRTALVKRMTAAINDKGAQSRFLHLSDTEFRLLKSVRCTLEAEFDKLRTEERTLQATALENVAENLRKEAGDFAAQAVDPDKGWQERSTALARLARLLGTKNEYAISTARIATQKPDATLALAQKLVDMPLAEWRRKRAQTIQFEIDTRTRQLNHLGCGVTGAGTPPAPSDEQCAAASKNLAQANEDMAVVLGKLNEYRMANRLEGQIVAATKGKKDIDAKAFQQLRTAANLARTDVAEARTAVLKTPDAVAPALVKREAVRMLSPPKGTEVNSGWIVDKVLTDLPADANLPDMIVVIEKEN